MTQGDTMTQSAEPLKPENAEAPKEGRSEEEKARKKAEKAAAKAAQKAEKEAKKAALEKEKAEKAKKLAGADLTLSNLVGPFDEKAGKPQPPPYGNIFIQSNVRSTGRKFVDLGRDFRGQESGMSAGTSSAPSKFQPASRSVHGTESGEKVKAGDHVWLRARIHQGSNVGKNVFLQLRQNLETIQAVISQDAIQKLYGESEASSFEDARASGSSEAHKSIGKDFVNFAANLAKSKESVVDVRAEVVAVTEKTSTTVNDLELSVKKIYCISRALKELPFQLSDATRSEKEIEENNANPENARYSAVSLDVRLNNRIFELRTQTNQAILRVQSGVCLLFREFLIGQGFIEIHSPKLIGTASEGGGATVFKLDYFEKYGINHAFLAQSPQLYKQMALMTDLPKVFEIGPVFRREDSHTHRHMTEFTGLDMEMSFVESYQEVLDVLDGCFNHIFDGLNKRFGRELEAIRKQFHFEDLKYSYPCQRFRFDEVVGILKERAPVLLQWRIEENQKKQAQLDETKDSEEWHRLKKSQEEDAHHIEELKTKLPYEDLSTKDERLLGIIMHATKDGKSHPSGVRGYDTDFYIVDKFPSAVRPFYTMECPEDKTWSNSYDIFIRGEEIMSGAQRIHDSKMLLKRAAGMDPPVDLKPIQDYVDAFSCGAWPHAGGGVGMERVVMLFLGLDNIRRASFCPRDPKRITP